MISINQLTVRFGGFELLSSISFMINPRDRIGLVGKNGAGKSTLLKIIAGYDKPTEGGISLPQDVTFGYLPQNMHYTDTLPVMEETMKAFNEVREIEKKIAEANHQIAERTDYESAEYLKLIDKVTELTERYRILGGENTEALAEQTLIGLGFERKDFTRPTIQFSGGWRMRIELAKILLKRPSVFLLDEPTNHLDIESIQWLEDFLKNYNGAVVLVSHDRAFLDAITTRTIEISLSKVNDYKVPYSQYVELRKERRTQQIAAFENQQKMIEETEKFIERFRYKATKAVQVQSRIKQLDKIERLEIEEEDKSSLNIKFPPAPRSGTVVVESKNLAKSYGENLVFEDAYITIERGEKIAFVGKNGEGKTTLVRMIMNQLDYNGELKLGHNVKIGYFAQNEAQLLDESKTVFQTIDDVAVGEVRTKIRDILGAFLFGGESIDKKVAVLSGGERSRLALARLLLEPYSLLVLDEPTNHLDMRSKDVLKQALQQYDGTLILVSHDRYFLDGLVTKVFEFGKKRIKEHLGGIYDFLQRKKLESLKEIERKEIQKKEEKPQQTSDNKIQYLQRKEVEKEIRKMESKIEKCEQTIAKLENEIEKAENQLSSPDAAQLHQDFFDQYNKNKNDLDQEMLAWEVLHEELESLQDKKNSI